MSNNLYIQVSTQVAADNGGLIAGILTYSAPNVLGASNQFFVYDYGTPNDPGALPRPVFDSDASARSYWDGTAGSALLSSANGAITAGYFATYTIEGVDFPTYVAFSDLATVATTGSYTDLANQPTIPPAQVQTDWNAYTGLGVLLNKPSLATVAISGSYVDLISKPSIPASQVNSDWNSVSGISQVLNKPSLATVATTGSYGDLTSKPTIPTTLPPNGSAGGDLVGLYPNPTLATSGVVAGTYAYPSSIIVDNKGRMVSITGGSTPSTPSFSNPTRSFGTPFQVSSSRVAIVNYSIPVTSTATLLAGSQAAITWKYADDSGMTTNVITLAPAQFGAASGLIVTAVGTIGLSAVIPSGKYILISQNTLAGTPTYGSISSQEVLL